MRDSASNGQLAAIEIDGVYRAFPGVMALTDLSLTVRSGEIYGLAGENGSGKSTLLRMIAGLDKPDGGEVRIGGQRLQGIRSALRSGIAFVTQEPSLVDSLSVAENIGLGRHLDSGLFVRHGRRKAMVKEMLARLGLENLDLDMPASRLQPHEMQMVTIARALVSEPEILLLDEATSSLTDNQTERLFEILREMKALGKTIIFITHKLTEYLTLCDRIAVMRDSHFICELTREEANEERIVREMVGRELTQLFPDAPALSELTSPVLLQLEEVSCEGASDISVSFKQGEIFVLAGLSGCGRSELLRAIFGAVPSRGTMELDQRPYRPRKPVDAVQSGIAYIPAERKSEGIIAGLSVLENTVISRRVRERPWSRVKAEQERQLYEELKQVFKIKAASGATRIETLSGGNQQKALLARATSSTPRVLLLDEPTRGIDVGAKADIYRLLRQLTRDGVTVIVSTSDLQEAVGIADRIGVMFRGQLLQVMEQDFTSERVMYYATGNY
ncbi:sugar ABC transporter ATP-binding protein [Paenibacillus daejeonensis]|uniref:sugar ABC transporter ATP-binding protein n=1 Tax=Paenibacillus daejeonensis TaxID=135193 RepID=UPI000380EC02|nr:sugar ABC transporter ATP-binding protein [Paenibacillus daejeonensis]